MFIVITFLTFVQTVSSKTLVEVLSEHITLFGKVKKFEKVSSKVCVAPNTKEGWNFKTKLTKNKFY